MRHFPLFHGVLGNHRPQPKLVKMEWRWFYTRVLSPQYFNPFLLLLLRRDEASWALLRGHTTSNIDALTPVSNTLQKEGACSPNTEGRRKAVRPTSNEGQLAYP